MHPEQKEFCLGVKRRFPHFFKGVTVLDMGALDINGNNRYLFKDSDYIGLDVYSGPNVNIVCPAHEFMAVEDFDVVISTEMLEHDRHYKASLLNAWKMLKKGGLLLFTCASKGRPEHGTVDSNPADSPGTNDYYKNLEKEDIADIFSDDAFEDSECTYNPKPGDLYFWGIKK